MPVDASELKRPSLLGAFKLLHGHEPPESITGHFIHWRRGPRVDIVEPMLASRILLKGPAHMLHQRCSAPLTLCMVLALGFASAFGQEPAPATTSAVVRDMLDNQPLPLAQGCGVLTLGQLPPEQLKWEEVLDTMGGLSLRHQDASFTAWRKVDGPVICVSMASALFVNEGVTALDPAGTSSCFGNSPTVPIWTTQHAGLLWFSLDQRLYRFKSEPQVRLPLDNHGVAIDLTPPSEQLAVLLRDQGFAPAMDFVNAFLPNRNVPSVKALLDMYPPACRTRLAHTLIWGEQNRWEWAVAVQRFVAAISETPYTLDDLLNDVFASVGVSDPWIAKQVGRNRPTAANTEKEVLSWLTQMRRWLEARMDTVSRRVVAVLELQSDEWLARPISEKPSITRLEYGLSLAGEIGANGFRAGDLPKHLPTLRADPELAPLLTSVTDCFRALQQSAIERLGNPDSSITRHMAKRQPEITDAWDTIYAWDTLLDLARDAQHGAAALVLQAWIEQQSEEWLETPLPIHDGTKRLKYYLGLAIELDSAESSIVKWMKRLQEVRSNAELQPLHARLQGLISARLQSAASVAEAEGRRATAAALLCCAHQALGGPAGPALTVQAALASPSVTLLGRAARLVAPLALLAWPPLDPAHAESQGLVDVLEARPDLSAMPLQTVLGLFPGRLDELLAAHQRSDPKVTVVALSGSGPMLVRSSAAKPVRWHKASTAWEGDDAVAKQLKFIRDLETQIESHRWFQNWNNPSHLQSELAGLLAIRDDTGSAHQQETDGIARRESALCETELILSSTPSLTATSLELRRKLEGTKAEVETELKESRAKAERWRYEWNNVDGRIRELQQEIFNRSPSTASTAETAQLVSELAAARAKLPNIQATKLRAQVYQSMQAHDDERAETLLRYRKRQCDTLLEKVLADESMNAEDEEVMWTRWWLGLKADGVESPPVFMASTPTITPELLSKRFAHQVRLLLAEEAMDFDILRDFKHALKKVCAEQPPALWPQVLGPGIAEFASAMKGSAPASVISGWPEDMVRVLAPLF